jgi:D-alanyl-lipoteichoic acid acyltransferase DltB (MBOAT superfamily)
MEFCLTRQVLARMHAPPWAAVGPTIGLSYIMFRVIHLLVDAHGDELPPRLRLRDYICYLFCFLTFLAGPIQRVQDFLDSATRPDEIRLREAAAAAAPLIVTGYLKFTVVAAAFYAGFTWTQDGPAGFPPSLAHALGWLGFAAYLYVSFSGYTDVMRGIGRLAGLDLPENFDRPYAAANFLDMWSRWHISLSEWFKLYVFNPVVKELISRIGRPALTPWLGAAGYFITFFLMGVWHGLSLRFAVYGLCLGGGVSVNKLYQTVMQRRIGRPRYAALTRQPMYRAISRALAVGFFILALGFLWIPAVPLRADPAGWTAGGGLVVLVTLLFSAAALAVERSRFSFLSGNGVRLGLTVLQAAIVVAYVGIFDGTVPPLLYEFF